MVCAWYMDHDPNVDQREEHKCNPNKPLSLEELKEKTGVEYYPICVEEDGTTYDKATLDKIRADRGYTYEDEINIKRDTLPDYDNKLKIFFTEHLHSDEEIRFILDGSGYFDVRDGTDDWIRIKIERGDMLILPAGIYHRFTLDTTNYIKAKRFFVGEPVWTPVNRPAEEHPARLSYLKAFQAAA